MSALLEVAELAVEFPRAGARTVHRAIDGDREVDGYRAVEGVSFEVEEGETVALVGESGSGKSVTCLALMRLLPPRAVVRASWARFEGRDLLALSRRELDRLRGSRMAMVFQDPLAALDPLMTIGAQLAEVLTTHTNATRRAARDACRAALADVGIADPDARLACHPHELSGGMRQRVTIAMALLCKPKLVFADEPTTALDATIQAQILELLADLQRRHGTAIVFVTHSLAVAARIASRVHVMYAGRIVESGSTAAVFGARRHPYTQALLATSLSLSGERAVELATIPGRPPLPGEAIEGCAFHPRCSARLERCAKERPPLAPMHDGGREGERDGGRTACWASTGEELGA